MPDLSVNGRALAGLSCYVMELGDLRSRASHKYPVVPLWGRAGGWATWPSVAGRIVTVVARLVPSANTVAARVAAELVLKDWCGNAGLARLTVDEGTTPVLTIDAYLEEMTLAPIGHPLTAVVSEVQMRWHAPDPLWWAETDMVVAAPAVNTRYAIPLGSAPSTPVIRVMGAATNPVVTIRDSGGTARTTLTMTATLLSTDYLDFDCRSGALTKYTSGVASSLIGSLSSTGELFPFALNPAWGDHANARWPTLEVSAGQAELLYAKRYW